LWFDVNGPSLVPVGGDFRRRPTVVLVHGGPGTYDHSCFKPDFDRLAEHAQIVYLDLRGHGRSDWGDPAAWTLESCADDIRLFCDALGIERPIVIGHSMGGPIVLDYGARNPGHGAALVVLSGFCRWDPARLVEGFRRVAGDEVAAIAERSYAGEEVPDEEWARVYSAFGPNLPDAERRARVPKNLELSSHGMNLIRRFDIVDQLARVDAPTWSWLAGSTRSPRSEEPRRSSTGCPKASDGFRSSRRPGISTGWTLRTAFWPILIGFIEDAGRRQHMET
jgi:proline iminopeptidase